MSTLATANLSSDEEDGDFVPTSPRPKKKQKQKQVKRTRGPKAIEGSPSSSSSSLSTSTSDSEGERDDDELEREHGKKKIKLDEIEERRKRAREEFERMKEESSGISNTSTHTSNIVNTDANADNNTNRNEGDIVELRRARRFAGETIYEIVKLKKDDPEAVAYLSNSRTDKKEGVDIPTSTNDDDASPVPDSLASKEENANDSSIPILSSSAISLEKALPPKPKGPPPPIRRKPRQSLEAMSAALDKGKKMTTLEKSQMDWKSHTSSSTGLSDELNANRKNGGYLDKRDFLDRVDERRSAGFGPGSNTTGGRR
ncbi:uncharacterized protein IL334_002374 [Kwoniella shivajii]|uniref:SWR1-complex protein 5 n=1 Tax=Kwoniella shivajii TaxID=564305 RepID=A0ABZ1CUX5_9TREE|nr:hypothetical protein IL334_002374 [Kwoniella shivajii]